MVEANKLSGTRLDAVHAVILQHLPFGSTCPMMQIDVKALADMSTADVLRRDSAELCKYFDQTDVESVWHAVVPK